MAVNLSPVGGVAAQFFTNTGAVLTGGKLYTYAAGTTTPQTAYTTGAGTVAWTNPIVLDAAGRVSGSGEIWLTDGITYKFVLKDSNDVLIATYDNISGINSNFINFLAEQEIQTATANQTVFTLTTTEYQPGTNTLSVFVDGVNQYGPGAQYAYLETSSTVVTFVNGLHVGAVVKFTTTQTLSGGAIDSSQVVYDPPFTNSVTTNVENKLAETISLTDFGAVGDGVTNDTAAIQAAITYIAINGGSLTSPCRTYLITSTLILPFGNNATNKMFTLDFGNSLIKSNVATPNASTFTGLISGYLSGSTPVANTTGSETQVAANVEIMNLNLNGFGIGIRLHNFNYGCSLEDIQVENSFNGIELTRCFYLELLNISLRGLGSGVGGVGFKTTAFSNIMPMTGIKVGTYATGMQIGGVDSGKLESSSAEGCGIGIELISESTVLYLDTVYLENNSTCNLKFSAIARRLFITNCWFYGASTQHIVSTLGNNAYSNATFISSYFDGGITNTAINNIFGEIINCNSDPLYPLSFSGLPNMCLGTPNYEIDANTSAYNGPVRSLDNRNTNGLIATAYGGRFRNGITTGNNNPYQTLVNNSGSFEFTTQFVNDGFTALLWRVRIDHLLASWQKTYLVFFDNDAGVWRLYAPTAAGLTVDTTVTCTDNGGFLMLKAPTFTGPFINYSVVRPL
jgi:hypothetical protein